MNKIFKNISLVNWGNVFFILINLSMFISGFVIMFSDINIYYENGSINNHNAYSNGRLIMSLSTNAFPFISFIFNIFVIVASFSFSAVGTYVIVKKPKSNSVFLLITLIVITGFLIFMTYYANKYHQHYYYNDFLHFIKVMRFGN